MSGLSARSVAGWAMVEVLTSSPGSSVRGRGQAGGVLPDEAIHSLPDQVGVSLVTRATTDRSSKIRVLLGSHER